MTLHAPLTYELFYRKDLYRNPHKTGGKFILRIPAGLWTIIMQNNGFAGINPTPNPAPNADGSYTVPLDAAQWQIFQDNQNKPAEPVVEGVNITRDNST